MPQYQYAIYNNQYPDVVQENLDKMSAAGWSVHTCLPNYSEFAILWEMADAPAEPEQPAPIDPATVTKAELQDMAREQGLPVSGTKSELADALFSSSPPLAPS